MNFIDNLYDSFEGGSTHRKVSTYTGHRNKRRGKFISNASTRIRTRDPNVRQPKVATAFNLAANIILFILYRDGGTR
jgi:hypothetical protein